MKKLFEQNPTNEKTTWNPNVGKTPRKANSPSFNPAHQQRSPKQPLTEERVKEVVTEMLIEFNLVPKAQKKQVMTIE